MFGYFDFSLNFFIFVKYLKFLKDLFFGMFVSVWECVHVQVPMETRGIGSYWSCSY